jgi:uncharacterized protein YjbJ (UPF0337 family)
VEGELGEIIDKGKGRIKQAAGDLTDNPSLKREGQFDEAKGKVKGAFENAKQNIKDIGRRDEPDR